MFEQRKSPSKIYRVLSHVPSRKINRNGEARPHITELRKKDKLIEEAYNFLTFLPFGNTVILRSCDLQKKKCRKRAQIYKTCSKLIVQLTIVTFSPVRIDRAALEAVLQCCSFFLIPSAPYLIWLVFNRTPWQHISLHRLLSNISHLRRHLMFLCADSITH